MSEVISIDLGGTKILAAHVSASGDISNKRREMVEAHLGAENLLDRLASLISDLNAISPVSRVGIASAGPLDPRTGTLLDPTNLTSNGESWGVVELAKLLTDKTGLEILVDNDAAAGALAEHKFGTLRNVDNGVLMTLGTGVGVGVISNGELLRSGRYLHPEGGHLKINAFDKDAPCGCGNLGCVEAYVSGKNFTKRMRKLWREEDLTSREIVKRAREGDEFALEGFKDYAMYFAHALNSFVVLYAPEIIVISGGLSVAADLFLKQSLPTLEKLLERRRKGVDLMPKVVVSQFREEACLLGGAAIAQKGAY